jgi:hypothetical protein
MENQENKKMTLDKLARMTLDGLNEVKTELRSEIKSGFSSLESKIGRLDCRVEEIHDIVTTSQEGDIMDLQKRTKILERDVKALSKQI